MNESERTFIESIPDFYQYMVTFGEIQPKTSRDYVSQLRFLSKYYTLDKSLTMDKVNEILGQERLRMCYRERYNTPHAIGDLGAGLKKFLAFVNSDYEQAFMELMESEESKIKSDDTILETDKEQIVKARRGQGVFRQKLISFWQGCSVTQYARYDLLIASHIKPWRVSDNQSKLDVYNGLLLTPNLDKLFDKGYITFDKRGRIVFSKIISSDDKHLLHLDDSMNLRLVCYEHSEYLKYHNNNCFIG